MPKRADIQSVLLIGAGPIVIGQACEFDYSGAQACKALREEGCRIILVNSNPATIMTDPDMADATYIEPIEWQTLERIIEKEKPDAILPTMGGQTALNCALDLVREGVLERHGVELIGATKEAIDKAEDRDLFQKAMHKIGLKTPRSGLAHDVGQAQAILAELGFPVIIRPSFTMGGSGGGVAYNQEEFLDICERGFELSPTNELLIDESIIGWKEYELEVVRDRNDNCIIICSIENLDPMGVHTGDSITVAPAQTLTDKEYQAMRDAAVAVLREIGVTTGGANVQFGVNPKNGDLVVIEMNPRVSRSSALASKATGYPIAKVAAKLALGYTLDELTHAITDTAIPASFEPTLDYVVTKIPRFNFEKFPGATEELTTQMKSVGEVMAMGRCFQESLQKALRGLETGKSGLDSVIPWQKMELDDQALHKALRFAKEDRLWVLADAFRIGMSVEQAQEITGIDPWFLVQIHDLVMSEQWVSEKTLKGLSDTEMRYLKRQGFSDKRLAFLLNETEGEVREYRHQLNIHPVYKHVDTCAAEFDSSTAYMYSCYDQENESKPTTNKKVMVLGGGPNRIGQGIEFDYCCVHAVLALKEIGYETIMVNCNPETVSTDYDVSDRLYFESLTLEDVLEIVRLENPVGVVVQFGGQTPLKLAAELERNGVPIVGTLPDAIDRAEDRERFQQLLNQLDLQQPPNGTVRSCEEGIRLAKVFAYPLVVRPSHVLGGRAMKIIYQEKGLVDYMQKATGVSESSPLLLDHFLDNAIEVDVDAVCDGKQVLIGGILQHIEQAGIHSGDSSCSLPPFDLSAQTQNLLREQMAALAVELGVVGLINAQFAIQGDEIYILEVNPRASRTVPFIAKATGVPMAKIAARCMLGQSLAEQGYTKECVPNFYAVKIPVFPFAKFPGVDPLLGPEMRSTGEVMGIGESFGEAYAKGQLGAGQCLPQPGTAFISVRQADKPQVVPVVKQLIELGFSVVATKGTAAVIKEAGLSCEVVFKITEGRPHIVDKIKNGDINFIINTTEGKQANRDADAIRRSYGIRKSAIMHEVWYTTTLAGGRAACLAMQANSAGVVLSLQERHQAIKP